MGCAIQTLDASRIKGKWQDQLQWDLICRTPTWYNNEWESGAGPLEAGEIYYDNEKKVYESTAPTSSRWFSRFVLVGKRGMVVVRIRDEALTVDQILLIGYTDEE